MALKTWDQMSFSAQAEMVIELFPSLTEEEIRDIYEKWSKNEYDDTIIGETSALLDLQNLARTASISEEQRESERQRLQEQLQ